MIESRLMIKIRAFNKEDRKIVRQICCDVADRGDSIENFFFISDKKSIIIGLIELLVSESTATTNNLKFEFKVIDPTSCKKGRFSMTDQFTIYFMYIWKVILILTIYNNNFADAPCVFISMKLSQAITAIIKSARRILLIQTCEKSNV